jgi:hypothetical protein
MWRSKGIDYPMIILLMRNQRANADNRVVDVLWKFIPEFGANFVLGFAVVTIRRSEAARSGTVSISHTSRCGMSRASYIAG